ncbi:MAG: hypothetical protein U1C33_05330, partial [Candidatus Cloacimonadaceae bacterium]|nr:hypothetical protein [Candidatus Cloacimonadaceae bacterium]
MLAQFTSSIMTDPVIFEKVKTIYEAEVAGIEPPKPPQNMNDRDALQAAERYRIIRNTYNRFVRNGALLSDNDKKALTEIDMELSKLSPKFADNLLKAT